MRVDRLFKVQVQQQSQELVYFIPLNRKNIYNACSAGELFTFPPTKKKNHERRAPRYNISDRSTRYVLCKNGKAFEASEESSRMIIWRCSSPTAKTARVLRGCRDKEGPDEVESRAEGQKDGKQIGLVIAMLAYCVVVKRY